MIYYKTREEIELMRNAAQVVSRTLGKVAEMIGPGVTPLELDKMAEEYMRSQGAIPGFLGYNGFPASLCVSVNEAVVHGIPGDEPLKEGDIVSVDCGAVLEGFYGDHAYTFAIGKVAPETEKLLEVTHECLNLAIDQCHAGKRLGDIGHAVQHHAESNGYGVVRELVGHGLGKQMHEEPEVPNFGRRGVGKRLKEGIVLAIEPMINLGTHKVQQLADGWTITTQDDKPSAHFEHDVAIVDGKPDVLSTFKYVHEALGLPAPKY